MLYITYKHIDATPLVARIQRLDDRSWFHPDRSDFRPMPPQTWIPLPPLHGYPTVGYADIEDAPPAWRPGAQYIVFVHTKPDRMLLRVVDVIPTPVGGGGRTLISPRAMRVIG